MTTIIATGNNFGASNISFKCIRQTNMLILNSEVTFDPSNAAYLAASQLEIYVPDLPLRKSTVTGMLMFGTLDGKKRGTPVKSWIRDSNTIIVEKVTAWDDYDTLTLFFSNSYVPCNLRGPVPTMPWRTMNIYDTVGTIDTRQCYWGYNDDWVFLAMTFDEIRQPDFDTQASFKIKNLPDVEDFDGVIMNYVAYASDKGAEMYRFQIRDGVFTFEDFSNPPYGTVIQDAGFIIFVPRIINNA